MREDIRENRYDEIQYAQENMRLKKNIKHGLAKYFDEKGQLKKSVLLAASVKRKYAPVITALMLPHLMPIQAAAAAQGSSLMWQGIKAKSPHLKG